jgi:hypothetical protein
LETGSAPRSGHKSTALINRGLSQEPPILMDLWPVLGVLHEIHLGMYGLWRGRKR